MELAFIIYLIDNITALKGSFWGFGDMVGMLPVFSIVTAFALVVIFISTYPDLVYGDSAEAERLANREKYLNMIKKFWKNTFLWTLPIFIIGSILNTILPSKDTAYKMLAAYGLQETVEAASKSEDVKRLARKSLSLIEKSIDDYNKALDKTDETTDNESKDKKD